ncbi:ATP-binding cassette domain-containing protein [Desulfolutivibrio sulfoxidireducens]|uniref:ATP-binding cassette domain-containing protein n=1 Tax=Desulfolutivibrio sulfoxidireducens TaxID=2773299 RepID=UPI00159EA40A|nr:ATP-binding cassette domain-containing protein [Desulfolutivibrio sulfoxidireducens]QLA16717.1 ATP-binding cassette domain-containing protein [Desulfolutivibrio sulfoxidireducens]
MSFSRHLAPLPAEAAPPLVELVRVSMSLGGRTVLSDVSFRLFPGEAWAVVGENGSGKTTLLRALRGDIPPAQDGRGQRRYAWGGSPRHSPLGLRHRFGLVSREDWDFWRRQAPGVTVLDAVCAGFFDTRLLHQPPSETQRRRAVEVMVLAGLEGYAESRMSELSEGLLRAALVARALAPWPLLLALDEVFEGLDRDSRDRTTRAIQAALASGAALVATAHRIEDIPPGVTRAVILHQGRIVARGPLDEPGFFPTPIPQTGSGLLEEADPDESEAALPAPAPAPPRELPSTPRSTPRFTPETSAPPLFEIANADVYLDGRRILAGVNWRVDEGQRWAVLGLNGAGKSTLLRLVTGEVHPALGGTIRRPGLVHEAGADLRDVRTRIGCLSADLEAAYPPRTTARDVLLSAFFAGVGLHFTPNSAQLETAEQRLCDLGLSDLAGRPIGTLSTGQRRLVFLARAVVHSPRLLILDEPFSGLDPTARDRAALAVRRTIRGGAAVILVTHRPGDVIPEITRILRVEAGTVRVEPA